MKNRAFKKALSMLICITVLLNGNVQALTVDNNELRTTEPAQSKSAVKIGDANKDSKINFKDVVLIAQYVAGWDVTLDKTICNSNNDRVVDLFDAVAIARYIAGWDAGQTGEVGYMYQPVKNYLSGVSWTQNGFRRTDGTISTSTSAQRYMYSDYIALQPGEYILQMYGTPAIYYYDENKTNGVQVPGSGVHQSYASKLVITEDMKCISINLVGMSSPTAPKAIYSIAEIQADITVGSPAFNAYQTTDSIVVNMGDSVTGNYEGATSISGYVDENLSTVSTLNCAFGGCQMSERNDKYNNWSMCTLADAITADNYVPQMSTYLAEYKTMNGAFMAHTLNLRRLDFSKVRVITIDYSRNDFTAGKPIGTVGTYNKSTIIGALQYSVEKIQAAYPNIQFVICTPQWRCFLENGAIKDTSDTKTVGSNSVTERQVAEALIAYANAQNFEVCDYWNELDWNETNWQTYYSTSDGTHPLAAGRIEMGQVMVDMLKRMGYK